MTEPCPIRILSVDDHPLLHEGLAVIINGQPDMELVAFADSGAKGIQCFREIRPDVTLMDLRLPDMSGIDAILAIRAEFQDARIIVLSSAQGDAEIKRALKAGACGYIFKSMSPAEVFKVIRNGHSGHPAISEEVAARLEDHVDSLALSAREIEVLRFVADGKRNRDIAAKLFISEETVKVHLKHIMEKLGASDRSQAYMIALRRGIFQL